MTRQRLVLPADGTCTLIAIRDGADAELLRQWKNANREAFFHQEVISVSAQKAWLRGYLERDDDYMFLVHEAAVPVGCMGFRRIEDAVDVYNVILGRSEYGGRGVMGNALGHMIAYAWECYRLPVTARVLTSNPAVRWYERNGFRIAVRFEGYHLLQWSGAEPAV
jgi:RimJ/RimL family protein N-acetyltransferase